MSYFDYVESRDIALEDYSFYALIMAAMRQADTENALKLRTAFPEVWDELWKRYDSPGGRLAGEMVQDYTLTD
jgi:hypothetical protein